MMVLDWIAGIVLFLQLPIPLYWYVMHPQMHFWRRRRHRDAFLAGVLLSWPPVTVCLVLFRSELFRASAPPVAAIVLGFALIVLEAWIFWRVKRDLGAARLVGKTELSGGGQVIRSGIYGRLRHPRYVGSFLAIVGACLIAGTRTAWIVAAAWGALMLVAILFEEREMRQRFGAEFAAYCREVPRFLPLGARAGSRTQGVSP
jgi:protein-S-isoprenylcysteine O-methyltransferase Ste14